MNSNRTPRVLRSLFLGLALTSFSQFASAQTLPLNAQSTCTVTTGGAPLFKTWFQSGVVTTNGVVNPANSVTFPNVPNCSFYQWSEQMFLWLTSPAPPSYGGGDRIFSSPVFYDVSNLDANGDRTLIAHSGRKVPILFLRDAKVGVHGLPVIMDKQGRLLEIEPPSFSPSGKRLILNEGGQPVEIERMTLSANKNPVFLDKAGKAISSAKPMFRAAVGESPTVQKFTVNKTPIFLDKFGNRIEVEQGQADDGVLKASLNGSLVYYALMVNDVYAYFATGIRDGGIPAPGGNINNAAFPTTQANLNVITAFAAAHGKTFPDANALAVEVKTAWVEAAGLPNLASYITMTASIPTYTGSSTLLTPTGHHNALLALVSVHVVGSVAGHGEMVWATFEHFGDTPNASYRYNATSGVNPHIVAQNTGAWLFSSASGAPFNQVHMQTSGANIQAVSPFTITPSNTLRMKPFGAASTNAASNTEVISINNSVIGGLLGADVRKNYYMTGATWTIGGAAPSGGNQVGTNRLANTALETYGQGSDSTAATGTNCFSCHGTNKVPVSHVFCTPGTNCAHGVKKLF